MENNSEVLTEINFDVAGSFPKPSGGAAAPDFPPLGPDVDGRVPQIRFLVDCKRSSVKQLFLASEIRFLSDSSNRGRFLPDQAAISIVSLRSVPRVGHFGRIISNSYPKLTFERQVSARPSGDAAAIDIAQLLKRERERQRHFLTLEKMHSAFATTTSSSGRFRHGSNNRLSDLCTTSRFSLENDLQFLPKVDVWQK